MKTSVWPDGPGLRGLPFTTNRTASGRPLTTWRTFLSYDALAPALNSFDTSVTPPGTRTVMYAGYFTVNASVGGRFVGEAAGVLDADADGADADGELLAAAAALLDVVAGVLLAVGRSAVRTDPSSPRGTTCATKRSGPKSPCRPPSPRNSF